MYEKGRLSVIDLMLKLLTYEPYEKVSGNEKDYIDKVLSQVINTKTVNVSTEYVVYTKIRCRSLMQIMIILH